MLFFEADAVAAEEPPDRSDPRLLLTLIEQTALDFFQCQVGLLPNQSKQPFLMLLQRRPALALVGFGLKAAALPSSGSPSNPQSQTVSQPLVPPRRPQQPGSLEPADRSNTPLPASSVREGHRILFAALCESLRFTENGKCSRGDAKAPRTHTSQRARRQGALARPRRRQG